MECHAHEITHPIGPRPREPMPMRDHAHMGPRPRGHAQGSPVLQDKGRSAPRAPTAHPQGGCLPLGASPPLSGHGVCKALRSPLRSRPLTSSANHWANTRCPVGVTDRKSAEEGGGCPAGTRQRPAEAAGPSSLSQTPRRENFHACHRNMLLQDRKYEEAWSSHQQPGS